MKYLYSLTFILLAIGSFAQELVPVFAPIIPVTPTNATGSTRPRITLVNDSIPLITWTKIGSGNGIVYSSRWNGTGFDPAVQLSPSGLNIYCSADEGGDIASRGDTVFVVFFTTDSRCYSVRSIDGGVTWDDTVRVDHQGMDDAYTPDVQIMPGGNPIVVFEGSDASMSITRQMVCYSTDGGATYSMEADAHLSITGQPCECCPPTILRNDSMVFVLYRNNDNNRRNIVMTMSSDSGVTFPDNSEFDQTNWTLSSCPAAGPEAMFYQDSVLAVWKSSYKIYYGTGHAVNGGEGQHVLLEPSLSATIIQKHPAVAGSGDTVVFVWDDRRTNNYDVYIGISASGPQQLDSAFRFNDTTGTAENGTQESPHVVYDEGTIHLVYRDGATGKVMYRNATVGGVVGIAEQEPTETPKVFPVPAHESFTVLNVDEKFTLSIFNMNGQLVYQQNNLASGTIVNLNGIANGAYSVIITTESGVKTSLPLIKN